jgi:hypothetical protein
MLRRRRRMPKVKAEVELTDSWTFFLLVGRDPGCRLHDWVARLQSWSPVYGQPTAAEVWACHQDALIAEARRAGFEPFYLTRKRPRGAAVIAWSRAFCAEHSY